MDLYFRWRGFDLWYTVIASSSRIGIVYNHKNWVLDFHYRSCTYIFALEGILSVLLVFLGSSSVALR